MSDETGSTSERKFEVIYTVFDRLFGAAGVKVVYGDPVYHGDTVVVPAAEVLSGIGFGFGGGGGTDDEGEKGSGSGGGGGGRALSRPVAVIIVSSAGVRVEPVVDVTKIGLAAITAGGFMLAMLLRMIKPGHALRQLKSNNP